jgi:hypothetical protein
LQKASVASRGRGFCIAKLTGALRKPESIDDADAGEIADYLTATY